MGTGFGEILDVPVAGDRAHQQADLQQAAGLAGGVAHGPRLVEAERHRRLAEDVLAVFESGDREAGVDRARQADVDRIDIAVFEQCTHACVVARRDVDQLDIGQGGVGGRMSARHRARAQ